MNNNGEAQVMWSALQREAAKEKVPVLRLKPEMRQRLKLADAYIPRTHIQGIFTDSRM